MNPYQMNQANVGAGGGAMTAPQNPTPTSIGGELEANDKRLIRLHEQLGQLESRLSPMLRPSAPSATADGNPGTAPWSAVVVALRNSGYHIDAATARVDDLLSRLDV